MNDVLDVTFAVIIPRVRLAGENELHRLALVARELHNILKLLENQRRSFVGRKAPGKANGQRVWIEKLVEGNEIALGQALALEQQPPPRELDQLATQVVPQSPEFFIGREFGIGHSLP